MSEKNRPQYDIREERKYMIIPERLRLGDTIGVVAPSNPIIGDNIEELKKAREMVENDMVCKGWRKFKYGFGIFEL